MSITEIATQAYVVGVSLTMGYFSVAYTVAFIATKIKVATIKKILEKAAKLKEAEVTREEPQKLCLRCRRNPRPEGLMHCSSCQFSDMGD